MVAAGGISFISDPAIRRRMGGREGPLFLEMTHITGDKVDGDTAVHSCLYRFRWFSFDFNAI